MNVPMTILLFAAHVLLMLLPSCSSPEPNELDKLGWLKITSRGKWHGRTEIYAKITAKGLDALGVKDNPKRKPAKRSAKKSPARKKNPLRAGYSRATVASNIAEMQGSGYPKRQAVAASMRSARAAYRKKNARGGFPAHLQTAAERKGKAAPKRKSNPHRAKPGAPPKGDTKRAVWIRGQMRQGRSKKQAAALWKGQQAMRKKRGKTRPKARAGARSRRR